MKYITVKLTEDQAIQLSELLANEINQDYPMSGKFNSFLRRLHTKIRKALAEFYSQD